MGVIIRQSFKSTLITYFGVGLGAINLLIIFPEFLTTEEIGLRDIIVSVAMSLSIFTHLGLHSAMVRFFPYFRDENKQHNGYLLFCLLIATAGLLFFGGLFTLFRNQIVLIFDAKAALFNDYLWLIVPATAFMMYQNILEMWARIHMRIVVNALVREVILRIVLTVLTLAYAYQYISFNGFIISFVLAYALGFLLMLGYIKFMGILYINPRYLSVDRKLMVNMARYSSWMMIGGAGIIINERIDGVMLAWMAGLSLTGIYSISFFMGTIIEMPRRAISQIASSLIAQHWKDEAFEALGKLYKQSSVNQIILGGFLFLLIWSNIDSVFNLIPNGDVFRQGKYVVLFIGLSRLLDMANGCNNEIILNSPYFRFNLGSILFLGFLSVATNYFMIPRYGLVGAAAGSTLSILLFNVLKGGFIWFKLRLHPFSHSTWKLALLIVFSYLVGLLAPNFGSDFLSSVITICLRSMLISSVLLLGVWIWRLSAELLPLYTQLFTRLGILSAMQRLQK